MRSRTKRSIEANAWHAGTDRAFRYAHSRWRHDSLFQTDPRMRHLLDPSSRDSQFDPGILVDCSQWVPRDGDLVRLYFEDGRTSYGFWDGENWRIGNDAVEPVYWQDLTNG
jgi:hypothetical protein